MVKKTKSVLILLMVIIWIFPIGLGVHQYYKKESKGSGSVQDIISNEDDVDDNTSDIDGSGDLGSEIDFNDATGSSLDSLNMKITEQNTAVETGTADFSIQRGYTLVSGSSATITADSDYSAPSGTAFIRIVNTRQSGSGRISSGGNQNVDDFSAYISSVSLGTSVTFSRFGTGTSQTRVSWEIIEYIGDIGGNNEIIVLDQSYVTYGFSDSTVATSTISGVTDDNDIVVFITGQANPDTSRNDVNTMMSTAEWDATNDIARFTRGETGNDASIVSYAVVEFTGSNWDVQRVEHQYTEAGVWETEVISSVSDVSRAFIVHSHRSGLANIDEQGGEVYLSSSTSVSFQLQSGSTLGSQSSVVWVISNSDTDSITQMKVQHISGTRSSGGSEEDTWVDSITTVSALDATSIMGESCRSAGTANDFPQGFNTVYLLTTNTVENKQSDSGQEQNYAYCVVEWPATLSIPPANYEIDFEYSWTSADYDETEEEVCIYVASHLGTENLKVQYYSSSWTDLGIITSTGWNNFTATGLSGTIYTIRLLGETESSDTTQDEWYIDLITLHTWSTVSEFMGGVGAILGLLVVVVVIFKENRQNRLKTN